MHFRVSTLAGVILFSTSTAAGCASNPAVPGYSVQSADTARLRIALSKGAVPRTAAGDGMTAFLHTTEDCQSPRVLGAVYTIDDGPDRHDPARRNHRKAGELDMPLGEYDSLEVDELLINAGPDRQIALQFSVLLAGPIGPFTRCNISLKQDLAATRDYEIVGRFDTPTSCSAVVNELVAGPDGVERLQIAAVDHQANPLSPECFVKY